MFAFRLLLFCLIALFVYQIVRRLSRSGKSGTGQEPSSVRMVPCAQCNTHVPCSEAIEAADCWFCSTAHRDQYLEQRNSDGDE